MLIIAQEPIDSATLVLTLSGRIDPSSLDELDRGLSRLTQREQRRVVLDISEVPILGSQAVGILLRHFKRLHVRGGELCLAAPSVALERMLQLIGVTDVIPLHPTLEEALRR